MYAWTPDADTDEEEELPPKVAFSVILQEEEYESEDDEVAIQGWDPRDFQIFFHIQY